MTANHIMQPNGCICKREMKILISDGTYLELLGFLSRSLAAKLQLLFKPLRIVGLIALNDGELGRLPFGLCEDQSPRHDLGKERRRRIGEHFRFGAGTRKVQLVASRRDGEDAVF